MTWLKETGQYAMKYHAWPNPFRNAVKDLQVVACEDTWQAKVEMYFDQFGFWFFDNIFPSPVELTRKFALGSYKCGFYLKKLQLPSPLDIVWRDGRTSKMLLEIARPVTTGLWAMWAGSTVLSALDTWQTLVYAMEMCESDRYVAQLADASAPLPTGEHSGSPVFADIIWDPNDWTVPNNCTVIIPEEKNVHAYAFGYLYSQNHQVNYARISIHDSNDELAWVDTGPMGPNEIFAYSLEWADVHGAGAIFPQIDYSIEEGGLVNAQIECTRFTVRQTPLEIPNGGPITGGPPSVSPFVPCENVREFYESLS